MTETRELGKCSCGTFIVRVNDSVLPTCRTDGRRYIYNDRPDDGYCIFRCEGCLAVIDDVWVDAPLSETMAACRDHMHGHGCAIERRPGGYWVAPGDKGAWLTTFGTATVQALVRRGVAEYSEWKDSKRGGQFPIAAKLKGKP